MPRLNLRAFLPAVACLTALFIEVRPLASQSPSDQPFIDSVNSALSTFVNTLPSTRSPIIFGGNLVAAYGTRLPNEDLQTVLDYVDGLKAAGAQRIEFNPGVDSMFNPTEVAMYDAIVRDR